MPREPKSPGPDHPITIEPSPNRVTVRAGGHTIAETTAALVMRESAYPPVYYVPLDAIDPALVRPSETRTYCPYKGDASHYDLVTESGELTDAIWTYEQPYAAVAEISGHVAFYSDRLEIGEDAA